MGQKTFLITGFVLLLLVSVAILGLLVATWLSVHKTTEVIDQTTTAPPPVEPIDQTAGARKAAAQLIYALNESVNPCDNFYDFVCGGWAAKNPATQEHPRRTAMDKMGETLVNNMVKVLDKMLPNPPDPTTWLGKSVSYYDKCLKASTKPELSYDDITSLMYDLGGWPLINFKGATSDIPEGFGGLSGKIYRHTSATAAYGDFSVFSGIKSGIRIVRNKLKKRSAAALQEYVNELKSASLLIAKHLKLQVNQTVLQQEVEKVANLEQDIASIPYTAATQKLPMFRNFAEDYPTVGFQDYLIEVLSEEIYDALPDNFSVTVGAFDDNQLFSLEETLKSYSEDVQKNWLIAKFVVEYLSLIKSESKGASNRGHPRALKSSKNADKRADCTSSFIKYMDLASGRINGQYIEPKTLNLNAATLGNYILEAYHDQMAEVNWLDSASKQNIFNKLNNFGISYGWPKWIENDLALDDWYADVEVYKNQSFVGLQMQIVIAKMDRSIQFLVHPPYQQLELFPSPLDIVNAEYVPELNHLYILAGILQPPYYDNEFPNVVNFGAIGIVMGHEMGHGFDRNGVMFDYQGAPNPMLSIANNKTFWERTNCIINQYNNYCLEGGDICEWGNRSLTENEADILGIRMSFRGYKKWLKDQGQAVRLPGLEKYTSDQLFFLNYGRAMCGSYTKGEEKVETKQVHSIGPVRVIGAVRNIPEFSEAFQCPTNSYMNLDKKCMIWSSENIV